MADLAEKLATSDKMKELGFSASVSQSGRWLLKNDSESDSSLAASGTCQSIGAVTDSQQVCLGIM